MLPLPLAQIPLPRLITGDLLRDYSSHCYINVRIVASLLMAALRRVRRLPLVELGAIFHSKFR